MSHLWNQGHYHELSPECQTCQHRRAVSVYMSGNNIYGCGKYPLKVGEKCPKYELEPPKEETCVLEEEKEENFCADCHWFEVEEQYCFRTGCHSYNESTCKLWEPMPADEPIPAPGGKTVPTTYDLLYEEGGYSSNGV